MTIEYAPRGLVGALTPQANTTVEPEFAILWPAGVAMINARMMSGQATLEGRLREYWGQLDQAVSQFHNAPVDVVTFACTGASYLAGVDGEAETVDRLEQKLGKPFITAGRAVSRSLRLLGAERIGLVSPYPVALTDTSVTYWTASGFDVAAVAQVTGDVASFHPIYSIPATGTRDGLESLAMHDLDAVVMLGTGMPTLEPILEAADILAAPAMSCMLCLGWAAVDVLDAGVNSDSTLRSWIRGDDWRPRLEARRWSGPQSQAVAS